MTEDEMVGWYHRLNGHEFKQTPEVDEGQGSLVCYSPWGHKELDTTEHACKKKSVQFSSFQSLGHDDPLRPNGLSMPGLPVHHQLPEFTQTHAH